MAKGNQFEYYRVSGFDNMAEVQFTVIADYIRMLKDAESKVVFYQLAEGEEQLRHFFYRDGGAMYSLRNQSYRTMEDYEDALANNFPDAVTYYAATELGFKTFTEYETCREAGLADRGVFEKARAAGYIEGYSKFCERVPREKTRIYFDFIVEIEKINNAVELFNFASGKGYSSYRDFEKGFLNGFRTMGEYTEATRLGFSDGMDYRKAIKMGFESSAEYSEAKMNQIDSKKEFVIYKKLKERSRNNGMDEIILFDYLASQPNGRKIPVVKMEEFLDAELTHYYFNDEQKKDRKLPEWFTRRLMTRESINVFVYSDPKVRGLGIYDREGQYLEIFKIKESIIFIDGSNVAHCGNEKPRIRRIYQVVKSLRDLRFPNVVVIADASLKHKVSDHNHKKNVEHISSYIEVPAGTAADEFLIEKARKENGFIVTNDTFRDWKEKDKWVAEHIDKIRIPFIIQNDIVTFSMLEKFEVVE